MKQLEEQENAIDLLKFIFAIFIVAIHTTILNDFSDETNWFIMHLFFRLGVPFFFVATGYFYGIKIKSKGISKMERELEAEKYIKRNGPSFLFWSIVALLWYGYLLISSNKSYIILRLVRHAIFYPLGAMWFMLASMIAIYIITRILDKPKLLFPMFLFGYSFALICNTYYFAVLNTHLQTMVDLYMKLFISARNGLFVAPIFIWGGIWLSDDECIIKKWDGNKLIFITVLLYIFLFFEVAYTYSKVTLDDNSLFICLPFLSVMIFEVSKRFKVPYKHDVSLVLRNTSMALYFIHPTLNWAMGPHLLALYPSHVFRFIVILFLSILIWIFAKKIPYSYIRRVLP